MATSIPLHNFSKDDEQSIAFKIVPLKKRTGYDTSVAHRHNYFEIFCFAKGGGNHLIDFKELEIANHCVHFVSPGQVHLVKREPDTYGYVILFSRDFFLMDKSNKETLFELPFLDGERFAPVIETNQTNYNQLTTLIEQMLEEANDLNANAPIIRSYLNIFLMKCKKLHTPNDEKFDKNHTTYVHFKKLLESKFTEQHSVNYYANELSISEKQLSSIAKTKTGKTAKDIIIERIITESKRLLLHTDLSNKEIAYFLNFSDPAHFSKFFKQRLSMSPSVFKDDIRKKYK